jgi:hypothetical protein
MLEFYSMCFTFCLIYKEKYLFLFFYKWNFSKLEVCFQKQVWLRVIIYFYIHVQTKIECLARRMDEIIA